MQAPIAFSICRRALASGCRFNNTLPRHLATIPTTDADSFAPGTLVSSSPHPISHIRLLKIIPHENESLEERNGRLHRERLQHFHHQFWMDNNMDFVAAKDNFETEFMTQHGRPAAPSDLSRFYRSYLESSYDRHAEYNYKVWKSSFEALVPAFQSEFSRWRRRVFAAREERLPWAPPRPSWRRSFSRGLAHLGYGYRAVGVTVR
ncbi:hypothetical protein SmJEL517_g00353 [Synchytrium microbalum]|uniref:Apoptogenic protein 1, mitochondrial n=1 Tax=Synchytrium microbalum TaxID=1806994 RepID=A0A507CIR2_9FUNG|nr:uncharacterized protein SmJEL517_g00353 [Synchytrium microbalum]TPX38116.1 hypothetical protein SmJEL517_g00353 [Synchytrium microbalum]